MCSDSNISKHIVFEEKLFADWYSAKVEIPIGEQIYCYTCIYPLYAKHKILTFNNGIVVDEVIQSNKEKVLYYDHLDKVAKIKESLIDSLGGVLDPLMDTITWYQLDCDLSYYTFHFDKKGRLTDITLEDVDEVYPEDVGEVYPEEEKCLDTLKMALKGFNVSHLTLPKDPFEITLDISSYDGKFNIRR